MNIAIAFIAGFIFCGVVVTVLTTAAIRSNYNESN